MPNRSNSLAFTIKKLYIYINTHSSIYDIYMLLVIYIHIYIYVYIDIDRYIYIYIYEPPADIQENVPKAAPAAKPWQATVPLEGLGMGFAFLLGFWKRAFRLRRAQGHGNMVGLVERFKGSVSCTLTDSYTPARVDAGLL